MTILPCPFCGDDDPVHDEISPDVYAVICGTCGCIGPCYHSARASLANWTKSAFASRVSSSLLINA